MKWEFNSIFFIQVIGIIHILGKRHEEHGTRGPAETPPQTWHRVRRQRYGRCRILGHIKAKC